jgi:hypothetical protein
MAEKTASIDRSLWRFFASGGKGFGARGVEQAHGRWVRGHPAAQETVRAAALAVRRRKPEGAASTPAAEPAKRAADGKANRAKQALLGLLFDDAKLGGCSPLNLDNKAFREAVERLDAGDLKRIASFLSAVRAGADQADQKPALETDKLSGVEDGLAKRGFSFQMSGKINNVYVTDSGSQVHVSSQDGEDGAAQAHSSGAGRQPAARERRMASRNLGAVLGRMTKNFILGH